MGDSIAVNGICLTVTGLLKQSFLADVMAETLRRSTLADKQCGAAVNLERALAADGRFGGHMVSGHIDGTGRICSIRQEENAVWYEIEPADGRLQYVVEKGSIAVDGISLTVAEVTAHTFLVSVIPHTRQVTALGRYRMGEYVNLEYDLLAKYMERLLIGQYSTGNPSAGQPSKGRLTMTFLQEHGF